jgi:hypothetical protein
MDRLEEPLIKRALVKHHIRLYLHANGERKLLTEDIDKLALRPDQDTVERSCFLRYAGNQRLDLIRIKRSAPYIDYSSCKLTVLLIWKGTVS